MSRLTNLPVTFHICNGKGCLTCKQFVPSNTFSSSIFNSNSFIFCHGGEFSCKLSNIIYLITCNKCSKQYVGETIQSLHKRMNGHRSSVKAGSKTFLYDHFNTPGHSFSEATIQIIDFVDANLSSDVKNDLLILEDYWITTLGTTFPMGLNDKKKGVGNISQNARVNYFSCKIPRYKRGHGKRLYKKKNKKDNESVQKDLENMKNDMISGMNSIFRNLKNYNKPELQMLYTLSESKSGLIYNLVESFYKTFCDKEDNPVVKRREHIVFPFNCKFIDKLNLKSIIMDTSVEKLLPDPLRSLTPLKIFYKYNDPISLSIFNYGSFLKHLTIDNIKSLINSPCKCESSPFIYNPLGHVITGDLDIISNPNLKTIMSYGCKYRAPVHLSAAEVLLSTNQFINDFVTKKSSKYSLKHIYFDQWRNRVNEIIGNRINFYVNKYPDIFRSKNDILEDKEIQMNLKALQKDYIICSIDKASNNFCFICKKFYILVLMKELGFDESTLTSIGNDTYKPCVDNEEHYVDNISKYLSVNFDIRVEPNNNRLAKIFWNPKLHKNPYKARFIAGAKCCVTKPLNIQVNSCLKILRDYFQKYCEAIYRNSGINTFWSINSSSQFLNSIKGIDIYNLQVYDFTTLYTNLDLKEVEVMISEVIDLIFSERNKFICISNKDPNVCFFSKKAYNNHSCFDAEKLKEAVNFIIYNTYIIFGGLVFIQSKGIPMGGNSSSPIADLTVGKREFNYVLELMKQKKFGLAKLLSNNCRYVDDLITINYLYFHNIINDIYPETLKMERSGSDNKNVNYLDLNICITEDSLEIKVYNKTDDFNFGIVSLTFPHSNIPEEVGYNVFYSQILRYGTICSNYDDFKKQVIKIFNMLRKRGYKKDKMIQHVKRCLKKYPLIFMKYNIVDYDTLISDLCQFSS